MTHATKTVHYIRSTRANGLARAVCGIIIGDKRRTTQKARVTCKRCRQLAGIDETWAQQHMRELRKSERKPPKRVEVRMPTQPDMHRAVDAVLGRLGELTISDYEEVLADKRRLTRELDVALNGEAGAAKQASLVDLIEPARRLRESHNELRMKYAACIGLLCMLSTQLRPNLEHADNLDSIEEAVRDFYTLTGWSYWRTIDRIEVFPPTPNEG